MSFRTIYLKDCHGLVTDKEIVTIAHANLVSKEELSVLELLGYPLAENLVCLGILGILFKCTNLDNHSESYCLFH